MRGVAMGAVGSVDSDNSENLSDALFCCESMQPIFFLLFTLL